MLTVLRHAKSSWDEPGLDDFERPLTDRGRKAARLIGRELRDRDVRFDHVLASPAERVRETLDEFAKGYGDKLEIEFEQRIYGADAAALIELIRSLPGEVHAPMLVGHNPALQQLVLNLTSDDDRGLRRRVEVKFPTAAVAICELPAVRWDEIESGSGHIAELILPKELKD